MSDLRDPFAEVTSGVPSISWADARNGDKFSGVILPVDLDNPNAPYETTQRTNPQGEPLFWNPVKGTGKAMVTAAELGGDASGANPVPQNVFTLATNYRAMEWMSENSKERAEEDEDWTDTGLRRFHVAGLLIRAYQDGLKAAGVRANQVEVGGTLSAKLVKRVSNDFGGKSKIVEITYAKPTDATRKIVADYIEANKSGDEGEMSDPFAKANDYDEPPF